MVEEPSQQVGSSCFPGLNTITFDRRHPGQSRKMKVFICGEEKAPFPIKAEDAGEALQTEYIQLVPGSRDIEGRQARVFGLGGGGSLLFQSVCLFS